MIKLGIVYIIPTKKYFYNNYGLSFGAYQCYPGLSPLPYNLSHYEWDLLDNQALPWECNLPKPDMVSYYSF
jgi:hypothetical protein